MLHRKENHPQEIEEQKFSLSRWVREIKEESWG
jgi:hypothetical protein